MQHNDILQSILGSKAVSFYAIFAKAIGSVPAAVMLSQGLFWQEKAKHKEIVTIKGDGYFAKTADEWFEETGVTEEQQKTARAYLKKSGIFKEERAGLPAKMHYRVDMDSLVAVISRYLSGGEKVAVDNRSKKREITRTVSGNKRGQFAVINGSNIKNESLESFETNKGEGFSEKENQVFSGNETDADFQKVASVDLESKLRATFLNGSEENKKTSPAAKIPKAKLAPLVVDLSAEYMLFSSPAAMELLWERWCKFRIEIKHPYKSEDSVKTALRKLAKDSAGCSNTALEIIETSIAGGWQGLFPLKKTTQPTQNGNYKQPTRPSREERIARAIADGELIAAERKADAERRASSFAGGY